MMIVSNAVDADVRSSSLVLGGRILLSFLYLQGAWPQFWDMSRYIQTQLVDRGVPAAEFVGYVAVTVEWLGGVALLLGFGTRIGALVLIVFTFCTIGIAHRYWEFPPQALGNQKAHFFKELAIIGGLFLLLVTGAGRFSLDRLFSDSKWYRRV